MEFSTFCSLCWLNFSDIKCLKNHFKEVHDKLNSNKFFCHLCKKQFSQIRYLNNHLARHFGSLEIVKEETAVNNIESSNEEDKPEWLTNFYVTETKNSNMELPPSQTINLSDLSQKSPYMWWENAELKTEQVVLSPPTSVSLLAYECKKCSKVWYELTKAHRHFMSCFNEPSINCDLCGLLQYSKTELKYHKLRKHNISTITCPICSAEFPQIHPMIIHLKSSHIFDNSLLCELCGKIYKDNKAFKRHSKIHNTIKKCEYYCSVCKHKFSNRDSYRVHLKMHIVKSNKK
ncbi:hypothetical protein HZS_5653 [Henneguya salminicola]|nr:hypothetical protein HZS_5653 [Henneguya salminicola]